MSATLRITVQSRRDLLAQLGALAAAALLPGCAGGGSDDGKGGGDDTNDTDPVDDLPLENEQYDLPPITPNDVHYTTTCCGTPEVDGAAWSLTFAAGDEALVTIDLDALYALPARDREHTLMCIGATPRNQKISNAIWSGLPLTEVFEALGVVIPEGTTTLRIEGEDHYSTGLPIEDLDRPLWLVWRMNGEPLPAKHGFPARLLVPGRYGMKNPKWMTALRFQAEPYLGYWESNGWSDEAFYRPNTLIHYPRGADVVVEGPLRVVGSAFAGRDPILRVEVSVDGGAWQEATIEYQNGPDVWTTWSFELDVTAGDHTLQARCVTMSGARSNDDAEPVTDHSGWGGSMRADVVVS
ncbi:MAG TPA: molybdopterin-dependent oxidoreductase [Myxococcota bacterium]|nr:molybdopterin-dependent oxidoreductase [Myxococcota bacterium]